VGYVAPDGNEWDGNVSNRVRLLKGTVIGGAIERTQRDGQRVYKGHLGGEARTIIVYASDIEGSNCSVSTIP
jgi:hypothetical protein